MTFLALFLAQSGEREPGFSDDFEFKSSFHLMQYVGVAAMGEQLCNALSD
jgi:hypothetical protein